MKERLALVIVLAVLCGCGLQASNRGLMSQYPVPESEAEWIRNGEPIEFDGGLWYPQPRYDVLLDSEVLHQGEFRGVAFFVEKIDIRPFSRILTKFERNKFRVYEPGDQGPGR